jgi:hypothetical protein
LAAAKTFAQDLSAQIRQAEKEAAAEKKPEKAEK